MIGRLRAAYEENGGRPESNPFGARAVRIYLREVRESQAKARGIPYEKKKRKRPVVTAASGINSGQSSGTSSGAGAGEASGNATGAATTTTVYVRFVSSSNSECGDSRRSNLFATRATLNVTSSLQSSFTSSKTVQLVPAYLHIMHTCVSDY